MEKILNSIKQSLDDENYYSALVLSLIIPDICGKFENSNQRLSKRYSEWFNKYLGKKYSNFLSGNGCYALRCSFLHEGTGDTETQDKKEILDHVAFIPRGSHCNRLSNCHFGDKRYDGKEILQLSTFHFCQDIIDATKEWLNDVKDNPVIQRNISEILDIHKEGFSVGGEIIMK